MSSVTSIRAAAVTQKDLNSILADYLALYETRVFRQLLVSRLAIVACGIALTGIFVDRLAHSLWWISLALCLTPVVAAWLVERRLAHRLAHRLDGVAGAAKSATAAEDDDPAALKRKS
jgi:Flp pilus assembly protein TadB